MNHWIFIVAAYGVTAVGTGFVTYSSWRSMRNAEAQADSLSKRA